MSFRSPNPKPLAYVINASGLAVECRLVRAFEDKIEIHAPGISSMGRSLNKDLWLSVSNTITLAAPGEAASLAGTGSGEDQYLLRLGQPHEFWDAAVAAKTDNRRQTFRVRIKEYGQAQARPRLELTSRMIQGETQFAGELVDLSLGGCNMQLQGGRRQRLPDPGSNVLVILESPALGEPLRLSAQVVRQFAHTKNPRLGLLFKASSDPDWLRSEYRLQDYLMERQRDQIRFRAA